MPKRVWSKHVKPYFKGTLFATIGAFAGACIWVAIGLAADHEIGWIACIVGALTGFGMAIGAGDDRDLGAGLTAIGLALAAIFFAKVFIYMSLTAGPSLDEITDADVVAQYRTVLHFESPRKKNKPITESEYFRVLGQSIDGVQQMPPEKVSEEAAEARVGLAERDKGFEYMAFKDAMLSSPINGFFMLLAGFAAYRLGAGASVD
jgi:hypothetical protein